MKIIILNKKDMVQGEERLRNGSQILASQPIYSTKYNL